MTSSLAAREDRDDDLEEISEGAKNTKVDSASSSEDFEYSVLVGSYNWTDAAAEINYENCVLINREPALIIQFEERLDQIRRMG